MPLKYTQKSNAKALIPYYWDGLHQPVFKLSGCDNHEPKKENFRKY